MKFALAVALLAAPALGQMPQGGGNWRDAVAQASRTDALDEEVRATLGAALAEYRAPGAGPRLDATGLPGILADLASETTPRESWWSMAWRWVEQWLTHGEWRPPVEWFTALEAVARSDWLDWVARISMLALMALAAVLVVREIRAVRRRPLRRHARGADPGTTEGQPTLAEIAALPARERPGAVLRVVLASLSARGFAFAVDSATHRQIAAGAERLPPERRDPLVRLAAMAERARFGRWRQATGNDEAVTLGRALLDPS